MALKVTLDEWPNASPVSPGSAKLDVGHVIVWTIACLGTLREWKFDLNPGLLIKAGGFVLRSTFATIACAIGHLGHVHGTKFGSKRHDPGHVVKLGHFANLGLMRSPSLFRSHREPGWCQHFGQGHALGGANAT